MNGYREPVWRSSKALLAYSKHVQSPVHPAVNGYLTLLKAEEGKGSEGQEMGTALIKLARE